MARKTKMNSITSAEKTAMINKNNLRLKDDFLMYLRSVQRSEGTIAGYDNDLLIFFTFVMENLRNKDFQDITKRDLISLQNWLVSNGNSSARIRRVKAAISSLSNYCESILSDDEPEFRNFRSIVRKIENPVLQPVREKTVLTEEELIAILDKLIAKKHYDKACFLALAMYGGRRKAELCRFRVSDFDKSRLVCNGALYKSAPIKTKGQGGGKYMCCYTLAKKFQPYLNLWLDYRKDVGIESEWLFPLRSDPSRHIKIATANSWAETYSRLGAKDIYMHSLRHFFTSELSRAGIPDGVIQSIIQWQTSDMVRLYKDIDADEEIGMYFSNGDIVIPEKKSLSDI